MKIFQIGFNKCGTKFLFQLFSQLGFKCIYADEGRLAKRILQNFLNDEPLLNGYEEYDAYFCMENVSMNVFINMILFRELDRQYVDCKFILNIRDVNDWINARLNEPKYLQEFILSSNTYDTQSVILKWKSQWKRHYHNVLQHFGVERLNKDLIIFDMNQDHPQKILHFISNKDWIQHRFSQLYSSFQSRFSQSSFQSLDYNVYCISLDCRFTQIQSRLQSFGFIENVIYFKAIETHELTLKDYQRLSSIHLIGPNIIPCHLCDKVNAHHNLYHKHSKLCVHLSYCITLTYALEHSQHNYILILEDDVYFDVSLDELNSYISKFIEMDYDVCYLGFCYCKNGKALLEINQQKLVLLPSNQSISCKHAILYKRDYLKQLVNDFFPLIYASDVHFNHLHILNQAKVCIPDRALIFQDRNQFHSMNQSTEIILPLFN